MNQTVQIPDICDFMSRHLLDVFETMLAMKVTAAPGAGVPEFDDRVTGSVAFAGDQINGAVYLHLTAPFAIDVTAAMVGQAPDDLVEAEVNDSVGEVTNMLTGGLKSWLCDSGAECAVSTPAIIRGTAFSIEPVPDVQREWLIFHCQDNCIVVEIHIKAA
ncbi:MAG TPA: chemotaxis protein CheX [Verrucomicrobiae bacterium]